MSVTAARRLLDRLSGSVDQIFVLHDFDVSGFTIGGTLGRTSRRYRFSAHVNLIDIGLRLKDVDAMGLLAEPVADRADWQKRMSTLRRHGARADEIAFLENQRVELNAMTSRQFIDHLEAAFKKHRVKKVLPDEATLQAHARFIIEARLINKEIEKLKESIRERASAHKLPTLRKLVEKEFKDAPALPWDEVVADLIEDEDPEPDDPPPPPPPKPRRPQAH
jgi:Ser-tRNA(Ala) deacylase AlaX